jgi:NAD(P)-dependent dehydrogenase (short-subunit alcohol dehydrogenase family)
MNKDALTKQYPSSASNASHVHPLTANVTSKSDWDTLVSTAESKFGGLDILVNNAGTSYKNKPTLEVTEEEFDRVMSVNVKSIFWSVQVAVPAMKKRGGGSVVNIASIGAMRPRPGLVWYNASKGAVANVSNFFSSALCYGLMVYRRQKGLRRSLARSRSGSMRCVLCCRARGYLSRLLGCRIRRRI